MFTNKNKIETEINVIDSSYHFIYVPQWKKFNKKYSKNIITLIQKD